MRAGGLASPPLLPSPSWRLRPEELLLFLVERAWELTALNSAALRPCLDTHQVGG